MSVTVGLLVAALATGPDQWIGQNGTARAKAIIEACLQDASSRLSDRMVCVPRVFEACEDEHGTSQRQMNDCAAFSRRAWDERRALTAKRLASAKQSETVFPSPDRHIAMLVASEQRWDEWTGPDCEMQAALSQGGTYHSYDIDICLSNHAAYRAIELEALSETWGKIFNLGS